MQIASISAKEYEKQNFVLLSVWSEFHCVNMNVIKLK